jgi:predicted kinase
MCGPAGSGNSTYARRLEQQGMVRLSFDGEAWERLLALVAEGADVVLDFSFWSRRMREDYRRLLAPTGVVPETIFLATDRESVLERVRARRLSHPDDNLLDEELAARYFDHSRHPLPTRGR